MVNNETLSSFAVWSFAKSQVVKAARELAAGRCEISELIALLKAEERARDEFAKAVNQEVST